MDYGWNIVCDTQIWNIITDSRHLSPGLTAGGSDGSFARALFIMSMNPIERKLLLCLVLHLYTEDCREDTSANNVAAQKSHELKCNPRDILLSARLAEDSCGICHD